MAVCGVEVRLASRYFRDGRSDVPREAEVQGQVLGEAPVVLHVGAGYLSSGGPSYRRGRSGRGWQESGSPMARSAIGLKLVHNPVMIQ